MDGELQRAPGAVWRRVGDRFLALAPGRTEPAVLRGVAAAAWHELGEPVSVRDLVGRLAGRYDVAPDDVERDVVDFVAGLREAGLLGESSS